jgi:DNA-binding PadR family transcriptional regulator
MIQGRSRSILTALLGGEKSSRQLQQDTGIGEGQIYIFLHALREVGLLEVKKPRDSQFPQVAGQIKPMGVYQLTEAGRKALESNE